MAITTEELLALEKAERNKSQVNASAPANSPQTLTTEQLLAMATPQEKKSFAGFGKNLVSSTVKRAGEIVAGLPVSAAKSAIAAPVTGRVLQTPESRGVGQGAIQGLTGGYGMPLLRKMVGQEASRQIPSPTIKENIVGNVLSLPAAGALGAGLMAKAGKLAPVIPAAIGYAMNPSDSQIEPAISGKRAIGAAAGLAGQAGGAVIQKIAGYINPEAVNALRRGIKPGKFNKNFNDDAAIALPIIKKAGVEVNNIDDFVTATAQAKTNVWDNIQNLITKAQAKTEYINEVGDMTKAIPKKNYIGGNEIAKKMREAIPAASKKLSPEIADAVETSAAKYKNARVTVAEAEDRLQRLNADLTSYFKSSYRSGYVKGMKEEVASMLSERKILRQSLYDKIQALTGTDIAPLKKQYGALMNIQDEALGRVNVAGRQNPISLQEAIHTLFGVTRAAGGDLTGLLQIGGAQAIKKLNSSDYLIRKSVENVGEGQFPFNTVSPAIASVAGRGTMAQLNNNYPIGKTVKSRDGRQAKVTGYDKDGHPLVEIINAAVTPFRR